MNNLVYPVNFGVTRSDGERVLISPDKLCGHLPIEALETYRSECIDERISHFHLCCSAWVDALQAGEVIDGQRNKIDIIDLNESIQLMTITTNDFIAKLSSNHPRMIAASSRNEDKISELKKNVVAMNELFIACKTKKMVDAITDKSPPALFLLMNLNRRFDDLNKQ
jgi:hypothetical protein